MLRPSEISARYDLELETFWNSQHSQLVQDMLQTAKYFALSDLGIRIVGEKGSGKLHLARLIHQYSSREPFSFTYLDCGDVNSDGAEALLFGTEDRDKPGETAIPGLLESAEAGTLYLDMVHALPASVQGRLIDALESRQFRRIGGNLDTHLNVRIITGHTKRNGIHAYGGGFERDVPNRVSPVCINIPPLRERKEDIQPLIFMFLKEYSKKSKRAVTQVTSEALDFCLYYSWPGNIYELRNVIQHSALMCDGQTLDLMHMPEYFRQERYMHEARPIVKESGLRE